MFECQTTSFISFSSVMVNVSPIWRYWSFGKIFLRKHFSFLLKHAGISVKHTHEICKTLLCFSLSFLLYTFNGVCLTCKRDRKTTRKIVYVKRSLSNGNETFFDFFLSKERLADVQYYLQPGYGFTICRFHHVWITCIYDVIRIVNNLKVLRVRALYIVM